MSVDATTVIREAHAKNQRRIEYSHSDLAGQCEIIYDGVGRPDSMNETHCIHTWIYSIEGQLIDETIVVW